MGNPTEEHKQNLLIQIERLKEQIRVLPDVFKRGVHKYSLIEQKKMYEMDIAYLQNEIDILSH